MSAQLHQHARTAGVALVLLGTGGVGGALLRLFGTPAAAGLQLVGVANSQRQSVQPRGLAPAQAPLRLAAGTARDDAALLAALDASGASQRVVVDATASVALAGRHAHWLRAGYHVVSANKAAIGESEADWSAVRDAARDGIGYGDAATVGAGLPVLETLRRLRACGDRLLAFEGVLSGSLSWLFNHFDGSRPFSALLREAVAAGYTEPDPRIDLGGADVARKLLILARSAGQCIDPAAVSVESLVPVHLGALSADAFLARASELDARLERRRAAAAAGGRVLRHVAALAPDGRASVGLRALSAAHPAARLADTDNLFALHTLRYQPRPLVIQGPGAGRELTAQALLGDILALRRHAAA